jgi:ribosome-associated heat shock protein Hsp15
MMIAQIRSGFYTHTMNDSDENPGADSLRIDKWLWCARFFKSRAQASQAVAGGLVHVGGARVKPSRAVRIGETVAITRGEQRWEVIVRSIPQRRGPAPEARTHYEETPASVQARERRQAMAQLRAPAPGGRPDKRERRELRNFLKKG